jgi:hypothetical protein
MDTVTILRGLWRRRLLVILAVILAGLAASGIMLGTKRYSVGLASARILVNTPHSQIVELAPRGSDSLAEQALLLASLMVDGDLKTVIAHDAGLSPSQIIGTGQSVVASGSNSGAPQAMGPKSHILTTQVLTDSAGDELPIIEIDAQAPTLEGAQKLDSAAISGVHEYLKSVASIQGIPNSDRLQITDLGLPEASTQDHGPSLILALLAGVFVFVLCCSVILGVPALAASWRAAAVRELLDADESVQTEDRKQESDDDWPDDDSWHPVLSLRDLAPTGLIGTSPGTPCATPPEHEDEDEEIVPEAALSAADDGTGSDRREDMHWDGPLKRIRGLSTAHGLHTLDSRISPDLTDRG